LLPTIHQWESWSLPSKLTAIGTLVGILSFGCYLLETGYGLSRIFNDTVKQDEDVYLVVEFNNNTNRDLTVYKKGGHFTGIQAQAHIMKFMSLRLQTLKTIKI
jgi:hypothetical protein